LAQNRQMVGNQAPRFKVRGRLSAFRGAILRPLVRLSWINRRMAQNFACFRAPAYAWGGDAGIADNESPRMNPMERDSP